MYLKQTFSMMLLLLTLVLPWASVADHSWGVYKWKPSSIPFNLDLIDNVNSDWEGHLLLASNDWSTSAVLGTTVVPGSISTDPSICEAESGNVQVCNAEYGSTGWLGLAQISISKRSITAGVAKLNDTYFNTDRYNSAPWRRVVMCQEVAHTFGLGHQDETFDNANLGSCMDYTNDPDGSINSQLSNEYPNQHDFDQLVTIYSDSKTCNPRSPKCNSTFSPGNAAHANARWGRLVSGHGGVETYEKVLNNGVKIITYVIWTLEHAASH